MCAGPVRRTDARQGRDGSGQCPGTSCPLEPDRNSWCCAVPASVVGIPPTLMAGIYGMNFKVMPELDWAWGYPFGLAVILVSAVIPLLWFKWRGWF